MSYIIDRHVVQKLPSQSLAVIQCGMQTCHGGHTSKWATYPHYSVTFILEGAGVYRHDGREYALHAGEGFLITPGTFTSYTADRDHPWRYIFAIFTGSGSDALVHHAGLSDTRRIFSFDSSDEMRRLLTAMLDASRSPAAKGYDVIGYFLLVMSRLVRAAAAQSAELVEPAQYLARAQAYIEDHYPYSVSVQQIADWVGIDRTYLYRIFRAHTKLSPGAYLRRFRLQKAVEMMENDALTIGEIAISTGFYDVSHFYRCFTAQYGASPQAYRAEKYGTPAAESPESNHGGQ